MDKKDLKKETGEKIAKLLKDFKEISQTYTSGLAPIGMSQFLKEIEPFAEAEKAIYALDNKFNNELPF